MPRWLLVLAALCVTFGGVAYGQNSPGPQPVPPPPPIPEPVDSPYAGTISLSVDLTNVNDRVLNVRETIPVKSAEITLLYPQWLPGTHSPSIWVGNMAGLVATATVRVFPIAAAAACRTSPSDRPSAAAAPATFQANTPPANPRRERTSNRRAAKRNNEFSPSNMDCHKTLPRGILPLVGRCHTWTC